MMQKSVMGFVCLTTSNLKSERYSIIDQNTLIELAGLRSLEALQQAHRDWVEKELLLDQSQRQAYWTEGVAVGSNDYIVKIQNELGVRASARKNSEQDDMHVLKEPETLYQPF